MLVNHDSNCSLCGNRLSLLFGLLLIESSIRLEPVIFPSSQIFLLKERMVQELTCSRPILRIFRQTLVDEVLKGFGISAPNTVVNWHVWLSCNCIVKLVLHNVGKGRSTSCKLLGVATKTPNVDFFTVANTFGNLGGNPVHSPALRLAEVVPVAEEVAEAEICNFYLSLFIGQNVVALNVSVQHILLVHGVQT